MDTKVIPPPLQVPEETAEMESVKGPMVVFDLETTGLGKNLSLPYLSDCSHDIQQASV